MHRSHRFVHAEPAVSAHLRPGPAQRLAVNTGTVAVIAAVTALALVVMLAGKVLPLGRL
jgi:hypothetical protein